MLIETVLKNGYKFVTECEDFYCRRNETSGEVDDAHWLDIKTGRPNYVKVDEIVAMIRIDDCSKEHQE